MEVVVVEVWVVPVVVMLLLLGLGLHRGLGPLLQLLEMTSTGFDKNTKTLTSEVHFSSIKYR